MPNLAKYDRKIGPENHKNSLCPIFQFIIIETKKAKEVFKLTDDLNKKDIEIKELNKNVDKLDLKVWTENCIY